MKAFICTMRPRSHNAGITSSYKQGIQDAFRKYCGSAFFDQPIYGRVYYFKSANHKIDADNMSKPILDALRGLAFDDDLIIEHRSAGIIDLRRSEITSFDVGKMPKEVFGDFVEHVGTVGHLLYVEFGILRNELFVFGIDPK